MMSSYLDRYRQGEYEQVWSELVALGARVREEPVLDDAWAVALETMTRVRANVEMLIGRLSEIGYVFKYPLETLPSSALDPVVFAPPGSDVTEQVARLTRAAGLLPLSLQAWYEVVGTVNFMGTHADWDLGADDYPDPLVVDPVEEALREFDSWREMVDDGDVDPAADPYLVPIAPDFYHKEDVSGGMWYHIVMPNSAADARLEEEPHAVDFVSYLRLAMRWGGFPGFERSHFVPSEHIVLLRQALLPF